MELFLLKQKVEHSECKTKQGLAAVSGGNLSSHQWSPITVLATSHGHQQSIHYGHIAAFSFAQSTTYALLYLCYSNLWPQPPSWPLLGWLLHFKTRSKNNTSRMSAWSLGTVGTNGIWQWGRTEGSQSCSKWAEECTCQMCVACLVLPFSPVLFKLRVVKINK